MKIMTGQCDIAIGAGTESMTVMPTMMGNKVTVNPRTEGAYFVFGLSF